MNTTNIIYLTRPMQPPKPKKTTQFPIWRIVLKKIQEKQNEIYNRKLQFLLNQAYQFFYDAQEPIVLSPVDIPFFMYEQQRKKYAYDEAVKALLDVVREKRVDECYRKRMKELKNGRV